MRFCPLSSGRCDRRCHGLLTRLDLRSLLFVGEELAQLGLILVVEPFEVGVFERGLGVHVCVRGRGVKIRVGRLIQALSRF